MGVRVQSGDFDAAAEMKALGGAGPDGTPGAVVVFTGLVRDMAGGRPVAAMTIEHYPGMTEAELERIRGEAMERWPVEKAVVIHRTGRLLAGDAAFEAARFIMDFLKTDAPFWKAEEREGEVTWVEASGADTKARDRWDVS